MDDETIKLFNILNQHKNLNFVKRIINPQQYPRMARPDLGENAYQTHLMSYGTDDSGKWKVFPMVVQEPQTGLLREMQPFQAAYKHALNTGEYIPFESEDEADWFTKNYKKIWKGQKR